MDIITINVHFGWSFTGGSTVYKYTYFVYMKLNKKRIFRGGTGAMVEPRYPANYVRVTSLKSFRNATVIFKATFFSQICSILKLIEISL